MNKTSTSLFLGRYALRHILGRGNQAIVFLAEDRNTGTPVAIKQFQVSSLSDNERQQALMLGLQEGALQAALEHPALPRCYDYGVDEESTSAYLILEYIDGITLEDYLHALPKRRGTPIFPLTDICELGSRLAAILEFLHIQVPPIIFRDLKPSNVMLTARGRVVLIDFGVATHAPSSLLLSAETGYGTPGYAAPELYPDERGLISYSPRSDLYSLGALLHYLLTGIDPEEKASAKASEQRCAFAPLDLGALPPLLVQMVHDLLQIEPTLRPQSARLVAFALARLQRHLRNGDLLLSSSSSYEKGSLCLQM